MPPVRYTFVHISEKIEQRERSQCEAERGAAPKEET